MNLEICEHPLEKKVILSIKNKPKTLTEIAKELQRGKSTICATISRLEEQGILRKETQYLGDARKSKIILNKDKIKIVKTDDFYLRYFWIAISTMILSILISISIKSTAFVIGTLFGVLPCLIYIGYQVYGLKDKITVYKKIKKQKYKKEKVNEKP